MITRTVTVAASPGSRETRPQRTSAWGTPPGSTELVAVHALPASVGNGGKATPCAPGGRTSTTFTPVAVSWPTLVTVIVYTKSSPSWRIPSALDVFETWRSGGLGSTTASVARTGMLGPASISSGTHVSSPTSSGQPISASTEGTTGGSWSVTSPADVSPPPSFEGGVSTMTGSTPSTDGCTSSTDEGVGASTGGTAPASTMPACPTASIATTIDPKTRPRRPPDPCFALLMVPPGFRLVQVVGPSRSSIGRLTHTLRG